MDKGAHFHKCDFQVHSPRDVRWSGPDVVSDEERTQYARSLIQACRQKGLDAIGITDHHDLLFARHIREAARTETGPDGKPVAPGDQIVVFPGVELTLGVPCQAIVLFDADLPDDQFALILTALAITPSASTDAKAAPVSRLDLIGNVSKLCQELDKYEYLRGRYIVLPNVSDSGGDTLLRNGMAGKYKEMPCVGGYVDGSIAKLGEGNSRILSGRDTNWGSKRLAVFQTSDSRRADHESLGAYPTWVKWAAPTAEALRQACLAQESRVSVHHPRLPEVRIDSLRVSNSAFLGPIELELNPQYTTIIGGRGTGKSTILEYLRWALCDQPPATGPEDEMPNYQARRKRMVEQTLTDLKAVVEVCFSLHGTRHVVRRHSLTYELALKIGDGEFAPCKEEDVRSLFPIQAFSQKQLSNVAVRLDELTRFVHAPISKELAGIEAAFERTRSTLRQAYGAVQRGRALQRQIDRDLLAVSSMRRQAESIRKSLTGMSEKDRELVSQRGVYGEAATLLEAWADDIKVAQNALSSLRQDLSDLPTSPGRPLAELPHSDILSRIHEDVSSGLDAVRGAVQDAVSKIDELVRSDGKYKQAEAEWRRAADIYEAERQAAEKRATTHEQKLQNLGNLEDSIRSLNGKLAQARAEMQSLGDTGAQFRALRQHWIELHRERAELVTSQCNELTRLSAQEIRASLLQGAGMDQIADELRSTLSGSNLRRERIASLVDAVTLSENPVQKWDDVLNELELLAIHNLDDPNSALPPTPLLLSCGVPEQDCRRIATKLTPDGWLDVSLIPLRDQPMFEYRQREGEYMPFKSASSGQQATALLKVLLNQGGPPLVIDQPEEDLDNPVILEVYEQIWNTKSSRQLIFASHNANLVVNGDAELVIWCDYRSRIDQSGGMIAGQGAIDIVDIKQAIKKVMEGGERAFRLRKDKYGF